MGKKSAAVGRNGVGEKHQEGDGITPVGQWPLRKLYFRKDKMLAPKTQLEMEAITPKWAGAMPPTIGGITASLNAPLCMDMNGCIATMTSTTS